MRFQPYQVVQRDERGCRKSSFLGRAMDWATRLVSSVSSYRLVDRWSVPGTLDDVAGVFFDSTAISPWWPQFTEVRLIEPGDSSGLGRMIASRIKGFLPYSLQLDFVVTRAQFPADFAVEVRGDFDGRGAGRFAQVDSRVRIEFELEIRICRPLLQILSALARPILTAQHCWVMAQGEQWLVAEVARRRVLALQAA